MLVMDCPRTITQDSRKLSFSQDGDVDSAVSITFSTNGYHLATSHASAAVKFWDLRKQKAIATMNGETSLLKTVTCVAFDDSAKFALLGGDGGIIITVVKEWGTTCKIDSDKPVSGLGWTKAGIASCTDKARAITFLGAP